MAGSVSSFSVVGEASWAICSVSTVGARAEAGMSLKSTRKAHLCGDVPSWNGCGHVNRDPSSAATGICRKQLHERMPGQRNFRYSHDLLG